MDFSISPQTKKFGIALIVGTAGGSLAGAALGKGWVGMLGQFLVTIAVGSATFGALKD